jgi:NADH-quinone oxidoreductase subunit L
MSATTAGWLVLIAPLVGTLVIGLGYKVLPGKLPGVVGTLAIAASFVFGLLAFFDIQDREEDARQVVDVGWDYAVTAGIDAQVSILVDPLSVLMVLVVTGVSTLIHLYSLAYMGGDRGYTRFFAYLNFFVFSMLLLVLAANFLLLIVGWAFVGAASYLLISFWYRRTTATSAGIKAFVINVVGDVGLVLGTYFILKHTGTLDFLGTFRAVEEGEFDAHHGDLVAGCILLLVGAFAKSAQVPLHTWLPDAMEGPTPVSSLIHAATMVTAGVYLIARMHPLFEAAPEAADVAAIVGCLTLVIAGTIGLVVTDLKRVIAYSTMSQIGYMIMAVGAGAYFAGLFHLMTHAFFKALLFMGAGSVIGAMGGEQDLNKMGGFRKAMPFTYAMFVVGGLALAGFPLTSGFFSKDEILALIADRGDWYWVLYGVGYAGALLTAIYTWRMIFRAFHGEECPEARELRETGHPHHVEVHRNPANGEVEDTDVGFPGPEHHIAEHSVPMKVAMGTLAVAAILGGLAQLPYGLLDKPLEHFLEPSFEASTLFERKPTDTITTIGLLLGTAMAVGGIAIAYAIWVKNPAIATRTRERFAAVHRLFVNKWFFDELIGAVVVRPFAALGRFSRSVFERLFVNGALVGGPSGAVRAGSAAARALQSGFLRSYAAVLLAGVGGLALFFLLQAS